MFVSLISNTTGVTCGAGTAGLSGAHKYIPGLKRGSSSLICVVLCKSLFVPLSFFLWPLYCLSFFNIRLLITAFVMSSFSNGNKCYWWRGNQPTCHKVMTFLSHLVEWSAPHYDQESLAHRYSSGWLSRFDWVEPKTIQLISGSFPLNTPLWSKNKYWLANTQDYVLLSSCMSNRWLLF